jgi:hypothetical protein
MTSSAAFFANTLTAAAPPSSGLGFDFEGKPWDSIWVRLSPHSLSVLLSFTRLKLLGGLGELLVLLRHPTFVPQNSRFPPPFPSPMQIIPGAQSVLRSLNSSPYS